MTLDEQMEVMDANRTTRLSKQLPMSTAGIRKMVLRSLMEVPENQDQSSRFNAWFKQNQAKYKKEDGSYNLSKAVKKDFSQLTRRR